MSNETDKVNEDVVDVDVLPNEQNEQVAEEVKPPFVPKEKPKKSIIKRIFKWGCLVPVITISIIVFSLIAFLIWKFYFNKPVDTVTAPQFVKEQEVSVETKQKELEKAAKKIEASGLKVDLDETVMGLYSIELALKKAKNFESLTTFIMQDNPEKIAPDVLALKYRFFDIYKRMLDVKDQLGERRSLYNMTTGAFFDIVSSINPLTFSYSRKQVKDIWDRRLKEENMTSKIQKRLEGVQKELIDFYFDYMKLNSKYYKKWDTLCALRDRAYLAEGEGNTNAVIKNASLALKISPYDREAHILLARALLRRNNETDIATVSFLLDDYLKHHQGQEAPGYLLKGVVNLKKGNLQEAVIDFDQAAAYYPKQQEIIQNRLNLYHKRSFLNKSKEGRLIMNMYRSMMSGAGYFSPDFQLARLLLKRGEKMNARKKVFEHFFRRRQQGEWDKVLDDFRYASQYLDTDLFNITATDQKRIKIDIESAMFANSVIVNIINDSKQDIHNVTILLCVRFTDMFKGDYITFPVGETLSLVKAKEKISVGRRNISDITEEKLGEEKEFKDIIEYAGVLISDEMILWIEPNRIGEATETFLKDKLPTNKETTTATTDIRDVPVKDIDKKLIKMGKEYLKSSVDSLLDDAVKSIKDNVAKALDGSGKENEIKEETKPDNSDAQKEDTPETNNKPTPEPGKDNI